MFYSHLNTVYSNIQEGMIVEPGLERGTTGISGVPDKNYTDYHLHVAIQKNPYNDSMAGKYTLTDYMKWDWYLRDLDKEKVLESQEHIFH